MGSFFGPMGVRCQGSKDPVALIFKMKRSRREIAASAAVLEQFSQDEAHELKEHDNSDSDNAGEEVAFSGDDLVRLFQCEVNELEEHDNSDSHKAGEELSFSGDDLIRLFQGEAHELGEHDNSESDSSGSDDFDEEYDDDHLFHLPKDITEYSQANLREFEDIPKENREPEPKNKPRGEAVSELFRLPKDEESLAAEIRFFATSITHPWRIVDYHLYLLQIEGTMNQEARQNGVWLRDGVECRPLCYEEFFENDTFDPALVGTEPILLFAALPVADHGVQFLGSTYMLEYNRNTKLLSARHFYCVPANVRNIECVWKESVIIYSLPIMEIVDIMKYCLAQRYSRIEFLSTNHRCTTSHVVNDDPGMELIVAYRFCQFAVDFAEAIFAHMSATELDVFRSELLNIMEEISLTLQRASYRAWFAVREGLSMERFSHNVSFDRYLNDLFTYNKSNQEGSLRGKNWSAFDLETCSQIRYENTQIRRARNEEQLQEVFAPFNEERSQEQVFEDMLAGTEEAQVDDFLNTEINSPPILLPPSSEVDLDEVDLDNMIDIVLEDPVPPTIVKPAASEDDGCEINGYHDIPLEYLLGHASHLIRDQPELDTLENRDRLGAFLTELGIGQKQGPLDEFESLPEQGFDNDHWNLQVNDTNDPASHIQLD